MEGSAPLEVFELVEGKEDGSGPKEYTEAVG